MKKIFKILITLFYISQNLQAQDYSLAKVGEQIMGVYIFVDCLPANEYDYIATINVVWNDGNPDASKIELIKKAKKKYPNFNAMIFRDLKFEKADLIKFRELEITGGGLRVGDYAIYKDGTRPKYGEIVQLDNTKDKAVLKYLDEYGDEKLSSISYKNLSIVSKEQYEKLIDDQKIDIQRHQFIVGEKVIWSENNIPCYGEVVSLNYNTHNALVKSLNKYGEVKNTTIDFLKIDKIDETTFENLRQKNLIEIKKHQFEIGEKVSFIKDKKHIYGEVVNLNNKTHIATIKYLGVFGEDKTSEEEFFEIEKVTIDKYNEHIDKIKIDALQYKFEVGEKVIWKKGVDVVHATIVSLNEIEHRATIKFVNKDGVEKMENVSYLNLTKIN